LKKSSSDGLKSGKVTTRHANILRSLFVARTPPVEDRSADCRSNVENAPLGGQSAGRARFPYAVRGFVAPSPAGARRSGPASRSHYVVISRDGRKLVTRVRVMLP